MNRSTFKLFLLLFSVVLTSACSSPNPAAPPTPPAEIPAFLRFPDPTIDVSQIASSTPALSLKALVGEGGEFSRAISYGADGVGFLNAFLDAFLSVLRGDEIPVGEDVTVFETVATVGGASATVQYDFSDFDLDGDGAREGCSGHTASLPICFRIWIQQESAASPLRVAGVFTAFPTDETPGAGRFQLETLSTGEENPAAILYDHRDSSNLSTEFFFRRFADDSPEPGVLADTHAIVTQEGLPGSEIKTIRSADTFDFGSEGFIKYVGRFREGLNFWSGSLSASDHGAPGFPEPEFPASDFKAVCAVIPTGEESPTRLNCLDLGIDVGGVDFADFVSDLDVAFPSDFPLLFPF